MSDPKPGWLARHGKWTLPVGCLAIALLCVAFVGAIVFGVFGLMKRSDPYTLAMALARGNQAVTSALGTPVEEGWFVSGSIHEGGPGGEAQLAIPLSGPKGKGTLYVEARRSLGQWSLRELVFEAPDASRIDLLPSYGSPVPEVDESAAGDIEVEPDVAPASEVDGEVQVEPETPDG